MGGVNGEMDHFGAYHETYSKQQKKLIAEEFKRLKGCCYLEHAGATLFSEKQLEEIVRLLCENVYGNPHANNISSKLTEDAVDVVRYQILTHFNTNSEEYSVIFTSGATAALKVIGENFNYKGNGTLAYLQDNHTSVLGMRAYTKNTRCIKFSDAFNLLNKNNSFIVGEESGNSLFVYPAQSNFSGFKYPMQWTEKVKKGALNSVVNLDCKNWFVALDAASYASSNDLDLSLNKPDFVTISFYKIFGYPTGLGALLIKNSSSHVLNKQYYGGGTVLMAQSLENTVAMRTILHERFEDGTIPFLSIIAIKSGFNTLKRLNLSLDIISKHTFSLAQYVYRNLLCLHHSNGQPVAKLYHSTTFKTALDQGGIVNFNLLRDTGEYVGYTEVLNFANLYNIQLRTGCFCNPGSCQHFLNLSSEDVQRHFDAGHVCGDQHDLIDGWPTGSVRISFGYMSTKEDADMFLKMVENCFITRPIVKKIPYDLVKKKYFSTDFVDSDNDNKVYENNNILESSNEGILEQIILYPIKSCGGFVALNKWPITATGLKYDRQWMVINSSGVCVTQKNNRKMCLIKPKINPETKSLTLTYPGHAQITISTDMKKNADTIGSFCQSKVCGDKIDGYDCGDKVADWLSDVLDVPGLRLLKHGSEDEEVSSRVSKRNEELALSLANQAQYLLINVTSVEWLRQRVPKEQFTEPLENTIQRFRPNFVVKFNDAFIENEYKEFIVDDLIFESGGVCTRCQMICIDQTTGKTSKEPLQTLSKSFKGKISFGIYLNRAQCEDSSCIHIGSKVNGIRTDN